MTTELPPSLVNRRDGSEGIRSAFQRQLAELAQPLLTQHQVCIYTTGSYGRKEAWLTDDGTSGSDIDLFILDCADEGPQRLTRLTTIKLQSLLIETAEHMKLPEFDGDGRFLDAHVLTDVASGIGSDKEDAKNSFTARLLLILESQPLLGGDLHDRAVTRFVGRYFDDHDHHPDDFRPAFLMNDIERFWRTLCLNYEHKRWNATSPEDRRKHRLKDMKLGFSRLLTCVSGRIDLASTFKLNGTVAPEDAKAMIGRTPLDRILRIPDLHPSLATQAADVIEQYAWFLDSLGRDKDRALALLDDDEQRKQARLRQKDFHLALLTILRELVTDTELERFTFC